MGYSIVEALQHSREDALGLWPTCSMILLSVSGIRLLFTCRSAPPQHKNLSKPLTWSKQHGRHTASALPAKELCLA